MGDWGGQMRASIGRYQAGRAACGCMNEAVPGTSKIESDLFGHLNHVIGNGRQGCVLDGMRSGKVDMAFDLEPDRILVVEYDGAYWHNGRETTDADKVYRIRSLGNARYDVVRVREAPLSRLHADDVCVPKGTDAATCARLVLLHLMHGVVRTNALANRIEWFLLSAVDPLEKEQVECSSCWDFAVRLESLKSGPLGFDRWYWRPAE